MSPGPFWMSVYAVPFDPLTQARTTRWAIYCVSLPTAESKPTAHENRTFLC